MNVTLAHQIAPVSAATVSSLMMGFAWGTGGLTAPLVGAMADRVGIEPTLTAIALLPLVGAACALPLPRDGQHRLARRGWCTFNRDLSMRPTAPSSIAFSLGPGRLTPAVRALIAANVIGYLLTLVVPSLAFRLGLVPALVFERWWIWQPVTYMFLHGGMFHLLFNMLALWMFGVELERLWGTRFFVRYYFVAGIGAAATTMLAVAAAVRLRRRRSTCRSRWARQAPSTACCWPTR